VDDGAATSAHQRRDRGPCRKSPAPV